MSLEIHFGAGWQRSRLIRKEHPESRLRKHLNGSGARSDHLCVHRSFDKEGVIGPQPRYN
jgi:hypothetical protein